MLITMNSVREKFGDLRWVPMQPEFIEYPNAQILMIGEAMDSLGKAATADDNKKPGEAEPGQELARLAEENERRVDALQGKFLEKSQLQFSIRCMKRTLIQIPCRQRNHFPRPWLARQKLSAPADYLEQLKSTFIVLVYGNSNNLFFCDPMITLFAQF